MSLVQLTQNYAAFNAWANDRMVSWMRQMDETVLHAEVASSYPSLFLTLRHLWNGERFWRRFVMGMDLKGFAWSSGADTTEELFASVLADSAALQADVAGLDAAALEEVLHLNMSWAQNSLSRFEYIQHVINHSTFHRGQLVTMARGLGVTEGIPATDYNFYHSRG